MIPESKANGISDQVPASPEAPIARAGLSILLVEDHKDTRTSLQRLLTLFRHEVITAESAQQALQLAGTRKFDLVISDLGLPDQSGHELMAQLRDKFALRGIALSGYSRLEDMALSQKAGFIHHLVKPVNFDHLKEAIRQFSLSAP